VSAVTDFEPKNLGSFDDNSNDRALLLDSHRYLSLGEEKTKIPDLAILVFLQQAQS
jgi:hypothetical protein